MTAERRSPAAPTPTGPSLAGLRAVVTGGSSGIGRGIALAFAGAGADVEIVFHRSEAAAETVAAEARALGACASTLRADLGRPEEAHRLVRDAFDRLEAVDVWVNAAGEDILTGDGRALPLEEKLERLIAVDLRGTVLCSWDVAERMRAVRGGVILNVSWDRALSGMAGPEAQVFSAVKGGVQGFSRSLALTVAPAVRVNVLAPGWIATAFAAELDEPARHRIAEATPMRRWGTPADVAAAAVFLASPAAAFLTGVVLPVNGGGA